MKYRSTGTNFLWTRGDIPMGRGLFLCCWDKGIYNVKYIIRNIISLYGGPKENVTELRIRGGLGGNQVRDDMRRLLGEADDMRLEILELKQSRSRSNSTSPLRRPSSFSSVSQGGHTTPSPRKVHTVYRHQVSCLTRQIYSTVCTVLCVLYICSLPSRSSRRYL
jgi:hypothetical protein